VVAAAAALAAGAVVALLVRVTRPPERQPFRFPAASDATPAAPSAGSADVAPAHR
jgi:hypothetical protein